MDLSAMLLGMGGRNLEEVREQYLRLPFAYPGNKLDFIKDIAPHIPYDEAYGEPFGGSGALLLNRRPSKLEVYNDRYGGITHFFRVVREKDTYDAFMARIEFLLHSREEFIWCKSTWADCNDPVERAARWYYTIRFAVNGKAKSTFGRSVNAKVPFSDRLHKSLPLFFPLHQRLVTVTIENMDWRQLITDYDRPGMVWYMDPTYLDSFPGAYEHELAVNDHKELVARIGMMHTFVAVSSYEGELTNSIYDVAGTWDDKIIWERNTTALTQAFTETNGLANLQTTSDREVKKEVLWIRYAH